MPRAPFIGIVALAFGTAIAFAAIYVVGTIAELFVDEGVTKENLKAAATWALFLVPISYLGLLMLRLARTSFLPMGVSHDGEVRVEFTAPPRIGHAVEGRLWAKRNFQAGDSFQLRLWCDRGTLVHVRGRDKSGVDHVFFEEKTTVAAGSAGAASLPFRFDVPADMPVSEPRYSTEPDRPRWFLELVEPKARFGSGSHEIDFQMGRAPVEAQIGAHAA